MDFRGWRSESGAPWPYKDEFEVGCTLEHAGYYVTWLVAFFGPARSITSFASCLVPDKGVPVERVTPDFTVACIEFASGVVARLTCSLYAPHEHALRIVGDEGLLSISDCWDYASPVRLQRRTRLGLRAEKHPRVARLAGLGPKRVPLVRQPRFEWKARGANRMDFARGVAEPADSICEGRACRLSARFALHVNEIVLAIQNPGAMGTPRALETACEAMEPMVWAAP
jgi:predicted dehydrogenase